MAAAALCCGSLLCYDAIAGDFFICPYLRLTAETESNFAEIALSFKPPAKKDFGILKIKYLFSVIFNFQCRRL